MRAIVSNSCQPIAHLTAVKITLSIDNGMTISYQEGMKTAISIPDQLFDEVESFSKKHRRSRSEVFVMAVRKFLEKEKNRELLDALNEAYSEEEIAEEKTLREKGKRYYARKVLKESHGD